MKKRKLTLFNFFKSERKPVKKIEVANIRKI